MEAQAEARAQRLRAVMREGERVTPLELFFDLVFVLALTQCTTLMLDNPSWAGLAASTFLGVGLVIIVALGESIVALGVGADVGLTLSVATTAVLGIVLVFELWWIYFDVVAIANVRRLVRAPAGRERNALARDAYSYLHYPLVAGIVLAALGLHEALAHADDPLKTVPAFALLGGVAIYLLGHVAVRLRGAHTLNRRRLALALVLLALIPAALEVPALVTLAALTALLCAMIAYDTRSYGEGRDRVRHEYAVAGASSRHSPR